MGLSVYGCVPRLKCTLCFFISPLFFFLLFLVSPAITVSQGEVSSPQRVTASQQQTRISASSATRELDELMASLSDFKVPYHDNLMLHLVPPHPYTLLPISHVC